MTILRTMRNFSSMNIAASILLFVAAIAAAIIANSPVAPVYQEFLLHELHLQIGNFNHYSSLKPSFSPKGQIFLSE